MGDEQSGFPHIVIIGASSGGIDAISRLLDSLPEEFPVPVIIAQHLDPQRPSQMVDILSRHTELAVHKLEDQAELDPGSIHVIPANTTVAFADSDIRVFEDGANRPLPSIDRLLSTAANTYGERLIAVILTGTGSDGTSGAHQVKAKHGTVIIQNPRTAEYPGMPRSLAPTSVDFVRDLDDIGPLLATLITDPDSLAPRVVRDDGDLDAFLGHVQSRSDIDFSQYKKPTILRRLNRRLVATDTRNLEEYTRYLRRHSEEYHQLVGSFLIKVTEFFRDPELFTYLRHEILPGLIEEGRKRGGQLRFWSAGCATGEEAYSLAILLAEALGEELHQFNIRIFATDIDASAISFARNGVYPEASVRQLPPEIVGRYFTQVDTEYEIDKNLRSLVVFGLHDLAQRSPFPNIDLILCRNVLIYFAGDLQRRALQLFAFSLRNDGYLVLGKSESTNPLNDYFVPQDQSTRVFRREGDPVPIPVGPVDSSMFSPHSSTTPLAAGWEHYSNQVIKAQRDASRARSASEKNERLLFYLPIGIVMVDQNYDVRTINDAAREILGIHGAAIGSDLLHMIRTLPLEPIRNGIDSAFRTHHPVNIPGEWEVEMMDGERRFVGITCYRYESGTNGTSTTSVVVVLDDVTAIVSERIRVSEERDRHEGEAERLRTRLDQLVETNTRLVDANRELASDNDNLRSSNEQLLVANEEAQAAAEEIETLNEELQTTNEELETLNEELQATVEELNATNEDMQARTFELQEERRITEAERVRLETVLVSMGDALMLVGAGDEIHLMNDACEEMFGEDLSGLRPETESGEPLPDDQHPRYLAALGEPFTMQFSVSMDDGSRRWYEASGKPIREELSGSGMVVVVRDITDRSLRLLQEEFMSVASHELRTPITALRGYLEMLQQHTSESDERSRRYITVAISMVDRLIRLISDLLDVGRLQSGKFELSLERTDLIELTRQTIELANSVSVDHEVRADLPDEPLTIDIDPMRVQQVLLNLLMNAITYSPGENLVDLRMCVADGRVKIEVQDYGVGIEEVARAQIFSRFFQGDQARLRVQRGLGLGLYISREIILAHHGEISLDSTAGEGSTFTITLPIHHSEG